MAESAGPSASAATVPESKEQELQQQQQQEELLLPSGGGVLRMLPAAPVAAAAALRQPLGCTSSPVSSAPGPADLCMGSLHVAAAATTPPQRGGVGGSGARFAVVGSLPWQQLLIPIGSSGVQVAGGSGGNCRVAAAATDEPPPCVVTAVPLCSLTSLTSQPLLHQQQQLLLPSSSSSTSTSAPAAGASQPTLQLLATPTGQLFLAPVGGSTSAAAAEGYGSCGSLASFQPLTFIHSGTPAAAPALPTTATTQAALPPATEMMLLPPRPSITCQILPPQSRAADGRSLVAIVGDQYAYGPMASLAGGCGGGGVIQIAAGGAGCFMAQLLSGYVQGAVPSEAAATAATTMAASAPTTTLLPDGRQHQRCSAERPGQQPELYRADFSSQGCDDYGPLPSIQTLAQHCSASSSASSEAVATLSAAGSVAHRAAADPRLHLPLIASSTSHSGGSADLGGGIGAGVPSTYQLYAVAGLPPPATAAASAAPDFLGSAASSSPAAPLQQQRLGGAETLPAAMASGTDDALLQASDCQPSSTVMSSASVVCDDGGAAGACCSSSSSSSSGCCLSTVVDGNDVAAVEEIREFARQFKLRRLSLGLTQTQVGQALSGATSEGPAYSQSAICRFEKLDITPKSAHKIRPVLEQWLREAEERQQIAAAGGGNDGPAGADNFASAVTSLFDPEDSAARGCGSGAAECPDSALAAAAAGEPLQQAAVAAAAAPARKRKRRTSFTPFAVDALNEYFRRNTHPSGAEMTELASRLKYEREVVRVWFCNKRQALKNGSNRLRLSSGGSRSLAGVASADAAMVDAAASSIAGVAAIGDGGDRDDLSACVVGSSTPFG